MLQMLCSSVRVKLLARAKLIFLREQPDDFFPVGNPDLNTNICMFDLKLNKCVNLSLTWSCGFKWVSVQTIISLYVHT